MKYLVTNHDRCTGCNTCQILLPKLQDDYGGTIEVKEHIFEANKDRIYAAIKGCPNKALSMKDEA